MNVGILVYPGVNELDVAGPLAVFGAARTIAVPPHPRPTNFTVCTLADTLDVVEGANGLRFIPSDLEATAPGLDVLFVPGSAVEPPPERTEALLTIIRERARDAQLVCAADTGVFLVARAGLLRGKRATTHPEALGELKKFDAAVAAKARVVADGNVMTGSGRAAALDLALEALRRLVSMDLAVAVARRLNHAWQPAE